MLPMRVSSRASHSVRVSADGYRDWMQVLSEPRGDVTLSYAGERNPTHAPVTPDASAPSPMTRHIAHELPPRGASSTRAPAPKPSTSPTHTGGAPNNLLCVDSPY